MSDVFIAVIAASFVLLLCSGLLAIAFMRPVCTENLIRVDAVTESPKLAE
ncbi:hypothetical protein [Bradyrhizobium erythrophlei]|jgi:hypothetical protein|uniref:Uncharacterized protein n=1 Tax=Bradyrhizobium erythrophlei TaxID=1437360 RepID=A0A1M5VFB4_9BRAD|nr:hypothetical protein [Bradyrhizobium erythrophlei]SHH73982.1 hypothetical protein SAMN05443248_5940 [Bradyrhizobium erythrophlei]